MSRRAACTALALTAALLAGCAGDGQEGGQGSPAEPTGTPTAQPDKLPDPTPTPTGRTTEASPPATSPPLAGAAPPAWLGERVLPRTESGFGEIRPTPPELRTRRFTLPDTVPMLPGRGFQSRVVSPAPQRVIDRSTWAPGCPVDADELAWIRLTFWGFDDRRHTGELLVHQRAASDLVDVFRTLYRVRFPLEELRITRKAEQTAPPTGDGNNTGAFNCRPVRGETSYSQHAYGLAVDVNPFQNPYTRDGVVLPELASAYLDRDRDAPGMIEAGGAVVRAFARIGWGWGGSWSSLKDYQHFSANGR